MINVHVPDVSHFSGSIGTVVERSARRAEGVTGPLTPQGQDSGRPICRAVFIPSRPCPYRWFAARTNTGQCGSIQ